MEANTLQEIISRAADSYGSQTAFRYKVKRELEEKTYEDLHRDTMAFGRMLEEKGDERKAYCCHRPYQLWMDHFIFWRGKQ